MADNLLERLRQLDCCAVSDALDNHGINGVAHGLGALTVRRRITGRAVTVDLKPADGQPSHRHLCTAAVEASDADSVVVIAHHGRTEVAGWGGILSLALKGRDGQGVVIDGAARDIDEALEMDLPLYGCAGVPVTARGRIVERDWNVPVTIAGITVDPGDYVIADGSGVAFIPVAVAEQIISAAEQIVARERSMAADVRLGVPVSQIMGTKYETMLQKAVS